MMSFFKPFLFCVVSILFVFLNSSCDPKKLADVSKKLEAGLWKRNNILVFESKLTDTLNIYDFYINIRNTTDYPYSNLFLFITTQFPDKKKARDTVECTLADADGKWRGKGFGKIKENRILLKKGFRFPMKGVYHFEFEQAMRVEDLPGITDIGLRIEKQ